MLKTIIDIATTVNIVCVLKISGGEMTDIDKIVDCKMSWLSRNIL